MAPIIYNKALDDAQHWCQQQAENLQLDYYLLYCDSDGRKLLLKTFKK